jgi:hypothetical protein
MTILSNQNAYIDSDYVDIDAIFFDNKSRDEENKVYLAVEQKSDSFKMYNQKLFSF